jgi:YVTN family beta-propeller protein
MYNPAVFLSVYLIFLSCISCRQPPSSINKVFHIASPGGWDYLAVYNHKLYVSHGTQVNIVDKLTGDSLGAITNTNGVHGIAFDDDLKRGYTSNGRMNDVTVFDLKTDKEINRIATGENPDFIFFEPFIKRIITCNGRSKDLSVIDPLAGKVVETIPVGGKPEEAVSDGAGKLFVNVEDKNEIVEVDLKTFKVIHHWPLGRGESPTGLALDKNEHRLFSGCENLLVIMNALNGDIVKSESIGAGCDGVVFDHASKKIFTSNGEGSITVIKEDDGDHYIKAGSIKTKPGARTIAIDEQTKTLYLPTAEYEKNVSTTGRPAIIPGSFQVLVIHY